MIKTVLIKNLYLAVLTLLVAILAVNVYAAGILSDDAIIDADATLLKDEAQLFQTLQQGIALSLAYCEENSYCTPSVNREELERIITTLNIRIGTLSQRYQETGEDELPDIMISYADTRDTCTAYLDELASSVEDDELEEEDLGDDAFDIFRDADTDL
jgi:hypothetical protein